MHCKKFLILFISHQKRKHNREGLKYRRKEAKEETEKKKMKDKMPPSPPHAQKKKKESKIKKLNAKVLHILCKKIIENYL